MLRLPINLLLNLWAMFRWGLGRLIYAIAMKFEKRRRYVRLELRGDYPFGHPGGFTKYFRTETTFLDLRRDIKTLAGDDDVAGVILEPGKASLGAARNAEIMELLDSLREAGKHVVAHGDMLQTRDYLEATVADDVVVSPAGRLYTFGPRFEQYFLAGAFERHGIDAQFIHIGAYKAAANRFVRTEMSTAQRLMMQDLHDGIVDRWKARISERRKLTGDEVDSLFSLAPLAPRQAMSAGFVDGEAFAPDVESWLESRSEHVHLPVEEPPKREVKVLELDSWKSARPTPFQWRPLIRRPRKIAIVDLSGFIIMPGMQIPGVSKVIDPDDVLPVLRRLRDSRRVAAVILHINSPGGSALASDLIWKAINDLRRQKPVVAYCTDVAASGGYYMAVAADRIVCHRETVTGSIGVVTGKMSAGDALRSFGFQVEAVKRDGQGSEFMSMWEPLGDAVLDNLRDDARSFYRRFLQRVGIARGIERRRLHRYARGRVYLGDQAFERYLVDDVGGWSAALSMVHELCKAEEIPLRADAELEFFAHRSQSLKDALRKSATEATGANLVLEPLAVVSLLRRDPILALLPWRMSSG